MELFNLMPQEELSSNYKPKRFLLSSFIRTATGRSSRGLVDTLFFEPDEERFTMSWRACLPLRRSLHEIHMIVAGRGPQAAGRVRRVRRRGKAGRKASLQVAGRAGNCESGERRVTAMYLGGAGMVYMVAWTSGPQHPKPFAGYPRKPCRQVQWRSCYTNTTGPIRGGRPLPDLTTITINQNISL